ncbi:hypothetical protein KCP70_09830 [Salmonella enterica subsp. enterica]|nr:hypothetical protein KCP70_09830 [Salmonella enterica subsp. enterica]
MTAAIVYGTRCTGTRHPRGVGRGRQPVDDELLQFHCRRWAGSINLTGDYVGGRSR